MERVFADLCVKLAELRSALRAAQVAVAHDEMLSAEFRELVAALDEIAAAAQRARNASRQPVDIDAIRRALPSCQRRFNALKQRFGNGAGAPEALDEHRAGGQGEIVSYIERCTGPLFAAGWAISACWARVGEYAFSHAGEAMPGPPPL